MSNDNYLSNRSRVCKCQQWLVRYIRNSWIFANYVRNIEENVRDSLDFTSFIRVSNNISIRSFGNSIFCEKSLKSCESINVGLKPSRLGLKIAVSAVSAVLPFCNSGFSCKLYVFNFKMPRLNRIKTALAETLQFRVDILIWAVKYIASLKTNIFVRKKWCFRPFNSRFQLNRVHKAWAIICIPSLAL